MTPAQVAAALAARTPRTEAGKALVDSVRRGSPLLPILPRVLAIEAEAAEPLWRVAEAAREAWAAAEFEDGGFDGECVDYLVPIPAMDALREALADLDAKVEETP